MLTASHKAIRGNQYHFHIGPLNMKLYQGYGYLHSAYNQNISFVSQGDIGDKRLSKHIHIKTVAFICFIDKNNKICMKL